MCAAAHVVRINSICLLIVAKQLSSRDLHPQISRDNGGRRDIFSSSLSIRDIVLAEVKLAQLTNGPRVALQLKIGRSRGKVFTKLPDSSDQ